MRTGGPCLTPETPMRRAVALIVHGKVPVAPVLLDGVLCGILSEKDCFLPALHASYHREWSGRVKDHMSGEVVTVEADTEVIRAAEMFMAHPHRVFPVLDGRRCAGLLHRSDVLALLMRLG
ncbi:CBS domain-containing protein [Roseivivax sp. CAU 1761]